jgi:hypothetical protein
MPANDAVAMPGAKYARYSAKPTATAAMPPLMTTKSAAHP